MSAIVKVRVGGRNSWVEKEPALRTASSSCLPPEIQSCDQPQAVPQLAFVAVVPFLDDLNRDLVIVCFDPLCRHDAVRAVEAVGPVICHLFHRFSAVARATFRQANGFVAGWVSCLRRAIAAHGSTWLHN